MLTLAALLRLLAANHTTQTSRRPRPASTSCIRVLRPRPAKPSGEARKPTGEARKLSPLYYTLGCRSQPSPLRSQLSALSSPKGHPVNAPSRPSPFNLHSTFNLRSTFNLHSTFDLQVQPSFNVPHSTFDVRCSMFVCSSVRLFVCSSVQRSHIPYGSRRRKTLTTTARPPITSAQTDGSGRTSASAKDESMSDMKSRSMGKEGGPFENLGHARRTPYLFDINQATSVKIKPFLQASGC